MQTGYYAATGGLVTQMNRLDTIANNLANANTTGYKKDNIIVGDFSRLYKEARDEMPIKNQTKEGASYINRSMSKVPHIVESYTDQSLGNIQQTNNTFDFALSKENLFFAINTPEGVRLTRDGSFTLNDEGILTTKQGYEVLPADYKKGDAFMKFSAKDNIVEVDKNGYFSVNAPNSVRQVQSTQVMIIEPENTKMLQKDGSGRYIMGENESLRSLKNTGAVMQGTLERSNVNAVSEMVAMVETNRLVGMYQKVMDSQMNDMNRDAIEKIASIRR